MKKFLSFLSAVAVVTLTALSCNKEEKALSKAYTNELFEQACSCIPWTVLGSDAGGDQPWMQFWSGYLSESTNNQYGKLDTPSQYTLVAQLYQNALRKLDRIIQLNEDPATKDTEQVTAFGDNETQIAVARTLEAYFYMFLTDMIGPIVFTEAFLDDAVENYTPSYMNQQDVYKYLDKVLADCYPKFHYNLDYSDPVYGGDTIQWRKFSASLRMLLAIKLSNVDAATAKSRFAKAYADGGMASAEDGFDYDYGTGNNKDLLYYWCSKGHPGSPKNLVPNMLIVNKLQELNDPRMRYYFDYSGYKGERDESYYPYIENIDFCGAPFCVATNEDAVAFGDYVSCINSKLIAPNDKTGNLEIHVTYLEYKYDTSFNKVINGGVDVFVPKK